jgi:hypothetical protein
MKPRLLVLLLIIVALAAITAWVEYTSWKEAAGLDQQLKSACISHFELGRGTEERL